MVDLYLFDALRQYIDQRILADDPIKQFRSFGFGEVPPNGEGKFPYLVIGEPQVRLTSETCMSTQYSVLLPVNCYSVRKDLLTFSQIASDCLNTIGENPAVLGEFFPSSYSVASIRFVGGGSRKLNQQIWAWRKLGDFRISKLRT